MYQILAQCVRVVFKISRVQNRNNTQHPQIVHEVVYLSELCSKWGPANAQNNVEFT